MRLGDLVGPLFSLACLAGLYLAWPYLNDLLSGTWLADLEPIVLVVFVALALSGLHALEQRVGTWFARAVRSSSNH